MYENHHPNTPEVTQEDMNQLFTPIQHWQGPNQKSLLHGANGHFRYSGFLARLE